MIIDWIVGTAMGIVAAVVGLLPADATVGPVAGSTFDLSGLSGALGLALLFDEGFPVHESIALMGVVVGMFLIIDGYIAVRAIARWLPSWVTGGG